MAFLQNNVSLAVWTGYDTRFDQLFSVMIMERLLSSATFDVVRLLNIRDMMDSWHAHEWDKDVVMEYFGMDLFDNDDWCSYSPIPFHLSEQWLQKMDHSSGVLIRLPASGN